MKYAVIEGNTLFEAHKELSYVGPAYLSPEETYKKGLPLGVQDQSNRVMDPLTGKVTLFEGSLAAFAKALGYNVVR